VTTRGLLLVLALVPAFTWAQGLGDVAHKETQRRERKDRTDREARTYSNADLPSDSGGVEETATTPPGEARSEASEPNALAGDGEETDSLRERLDRAAERRREQEREWRARAAAARARVESARREHDAVCKTGGVYLGGG
jgi:hypothetical protein